MPETPSPPLLPSIARNDGATEKRLGHRQPSCNDSGPMPPARRYALLSSMCSPRRNIGWGCLSAPSASTGQGKDRPRQHRLQLQTLPILGSEDGGDVIWGHGVGLGREPPVNPDITAKMNALSLKSTAPSAWTTLRPGKSRSPSGSLSMRRAVGFWARRTDNPNCARCRSTPVSQGVERELSGSPRTNFPSFAVVARFNVEPVIRRSLDSSRPDPVLFID